MFQNRCYDRDNDMINNIVGDNNQIMSDMQMNMGGQVNMPAGEMQQASSCPMAEPVQERVVHRNIYHEVPHVCPIRTKVINHHIYRHIYRPEYSCCEENVCSNVQCGSCCQFK